MFLKVYSKTLYHLFGIILGDYYMTVYIYLAVKLLAWLARGDDIITTEAIDKKIIELCGLVM